MKLPIGISDFKRLVEDKYNFADKTHFIKEVMDDGAGVILITRPRRFGKTLNLSMLYHFFQSQKPQENNIFEGLNISNEVEFCRQHQNKYPAIFITFKDVKKLSFEDAYENIEELIKNLYSEHRYLLEDDTLYENERALFTRLLDKKATKEEVESALKQLSEYVHRRFNKQPVILIDEYDTPIQTAYLKGYYEEMVDVMRSILGKALKDNTAMFKAILTGITRVSQESLFSGLNNVKVYSLLNEKYGQYFGFVESEVIKLIEETGQDIKLEKIKDWYNGYQIGMHVLYNPWSIIHCLDEQGDLKPYWLSTSSNDLIKELVSEASPIVRQQFEKLLQKEDVEQPLLENLVFPDLKKKTGALWSLFLYAGYLNVISTERRGHLLMAKISIPNKEVMHVYDEIVEQWFSDTISLESYLSFTESLRKGDIAIFKLRLSDYIMQTGSYFDFNQSTPEKIFHSFLLGLIVGLRDNYIIQSNQEAGLGRFDVMFIPKNKQENGILLEFKTSTTPELLQAKAEEALTQIKEKQYTATLKAHGISSVLAIGLAFCGKQLELAHENIAI